MDELSLFFLADESQKSEKYQVQSKKKTYIRPNFNNIKAGNDKNGFIRHSSDPAFPVLNAFSLSPQEIHVSSSFNCTSNLPLALPPEVEEGNIEYKLKLISPDEDRLEHLVTQMKWRLNEGGGQAIYRLGVNDNGVVTGLTASEMTASITTIHRMARRLSANLSLLRECTVTSTDRSLREDCDFSTTGPLRTRKAIELHVKQKLSINQGLPDLCIAMLGSMDVGKSTLLGILTDGELDNGRGRARLNLFRHLHEVQSGRTSSLASELIGFDSTGRLINRRRSQGRLNKRTVDEVIRDSNRLITLFDLAGHPRYQRTTLSGLARNHPSFAVLVVSATCGLTADGLDHARTAAALSLPIAVVISKLDLVQNKQPCIAEIKQDILKKLRSITFYEPPDLDAMPIKSTQCFKNDPPIFALSSVSGNGLDELLVFLAHVSATNFAKPNFDGLLVPPQGVSEILSPHPITSEVEKDQEASTSSNVEVWVNRVYGHVPGVNNPVLEGLVKSGQVCENQQLWLGPDEKGIFALVRVLELRRNRQPHTIIYTGQMGSLVVVLEDNDYEKEAVPFSLSSVRRGMVLLSEAPQFDTSLGSVCWSVGISHLTWLPSGRFPSMGCGYLPPINATIGLYSGNVCQHAKVIESKESNYPFADLINSDMRAETALFQLNADKLVVQFLRQPEYLTCGRLVILSFDQGAKAVGFIDSLSNLVTSTISYVTTKTNTRSLWKPVSNNLPNRATETSLGELLRQVNINSKGTSFITESDLEKDPETDLSQIIISKKYRRTKRQRKSALQTATALLKFEIKEEEDAKPCEQSSSTSTWNSSNGEPSNSSGIFLAEKLGRCQLLSAPTSQPPPESLCPIPNPNSLESKNPIATKKRKRRHRRYKK